MDFSNQPMRDENGKTPAPPVTMRSKYILQFCISNVSERLAWFECQQQSTSHPLASIVRWTKP
jgi:hypothetical protein